MAWKDKRLTKCHISRKRVDLQTRAFDVLRYITPRLHFKPLLKRSRGTTLSFILWQTIRRNINFDAINKSPLPNSLPTPSKYNAK